MGLTKTIEQINIKYKKLYDGGNDMFIWYRNSLAASAVSVCGCGLIIAGVRNFSDFAQSILMIGAGIVLMIFGAFISKQKKSDEWWKKVEEAGLIPEIEQSRDTAVVVYNKNPDKKTLERISKLNPSAGDYIRACLGQTTKEAVKDHNNSSGNIYEQQKNTQGSASKQGQFSQNSINKNIPKPTIQTKKESGKKCPKCGFVNMSDARFCNKCGADLNLTGLEKVSEGKGSKKSTYIAIGIIAAIFIGFFAIVLSEDLKDNDISETKGTARETERETIRETEKEVELTNEEKYVLHIFETCLGRRPDADTMENWGTQLREKKVDGRWIAYNIIFSSEYENKKYSDDEYVNMLYRAMFGRDADNSGKQTWTQELKNGTLRKSVFEVFAESDEFAQLCEEYKIESKYAYQYESYMDDTYSSYKEIVGNAINTEAYYGGYGLLYDINGDGSEELIVEYWKGRPYINYSTGEMSEGISINFIIASKDNNQIDILMNESYTYDPSRNDGSCSADLKIVDAFGFSQLRVHRGAPVDDYYLGWINLYDYRGFGFEFKIETAVKGTFRYEKSDGEVFFDDGSNIVANGLSWNYNKYTEWMNSMEVLADPEIALEDLLPQLSE